VSRNQPRVAERGLDLAEAIDHLLHDRVDVLDVYEDARAQALTAAGGKSSRLFWTARRADAHRRLRESSLPPTVGWEQPERMASLSSPVTVPFQASSRLSPGSFGRGSYIPAPIGERPYNDGAS
jgi:hypothetical protein